MRRERQIERPLQPGAFVPRIVSPCRSRRIGGVFTHDSLVVTSARGPSASPLAGFGKGVSRNNGKVKGWKSTLPKP